MNILRILPLSIALLLISCAGASMRDARSLSGKNSFKPEDYRDPQALKEYVKRLQADGRNRRNHGVYIETLDGAQPVAMLNENVEFNPASVIKLATTLAALNKLGVDYRFRTEFRAGGEINQKTGELNGDLILLSGGDPSFSIANARQAGELLGRRGIRKINGALVVVGEFSCNENASKQNSADTFRKESKLIFRSPTRYQTFLEYEPRGSSLLTIESDTLLKIVQYLNARSINSMADRLASHIGGARGVQKFIVEEVGIHTYSVYISHASGLEVNRMTPRDTVKLLRAMIQWLAKRNLNPSDVMAVAGIDYGTLRGRFGGNKFAGSVVAKTGTLYSTDTGVAALAGVMYTRNRGPLLFAVYDVAEGKRVKSLRPLQDELLKQIIVECGGPQPPARAAQLGNHSKLESRVIGWMKDVVSKK
jgi:serine-type D-Ala-D-Ala carboxypeptidase/endopeptidase (penicillin-binding protein 4)